MLMLLLIIDKVRDGEASLGRMRRLKNTLVTANTQVVSAVHDVDSVRNIANRILIGSGRISWMCVVGTPTLTK